MSTNRALDFATRNLIAETVRETVEREIRENASLFQLRNETALQLHGPCSTAAESLVIGSVLNGTVLASDLPLEPEHFWAATHGRIWTALRATESLHGPGPEHWRVTHQLDVLGLLAGPRDAIAGECEQMATLAADYAGLRDVAAAVLLIQEHARARRLISLLVDLATSLAMSTATHSSAKLSLRAHFMTPENR